MSSDLTGMADELAKLADLRAKGVLTDEEFAAAKTALLRRAAGPVAPVEVPVPAPPVPLPADPRPGPAVDGPPPTALPDMTGTWVFTEGDRFWMFWPDGRFRDGGTQAESDYAVKSPDLLEIRASEPGREVYRVVETSLGLELTSSSGKRLVARRATRADLEKRLHAEWLAEESRYAGFQGQRPETGYGLGAILLGVPAGLFFYHVAMDGMNLAENEGWKTLGLLLLACAFLVGGAVVGVGNLAGARDLAVVRKRFTWRQEAVVEDFERLAALKPGDPDPPRPDADLLTAEFMSPRPRPTGALWGLCVLYILICGFVGEVLYAQLIKDRAPVEQVNQYYCDARREFNGYTLQDWGAVEKYTNRLRSVDTSGCPADFQAKYRAFIEAEASYLSTRFLKQHGLPGGEKHILATEERRLALAGLVRESRRVRAKWYIAPDR